ncbi:MAG: 4Fe-4S binding protein [Firmicutes bacterium]|nr:4Fe-4S binding protein [Bacillota bacterium]
MANSKPLFNEQFCKGCSLCVAACPGELIGLKGDLNKLGYHPAGLTKDENCNGCGLCAIMCPDMIITVDRGLWHENVDERKRSHR